MRIKLITIILLSSTLLLFQGCCEKKHSIEFASSELTSIQQDHDLCYSKEAVILNESEYNTDDGTAILAIPVPKGHYLKRIKQGSNKVYFETNGLGFSPQYNTVKVRLKGLSQTKKSTLYVYLDINFSGTDTCINDEGAAVLGVKKKGSEIAGHPIHGKTER